MTCPICPGSALHSPQLWLEQRLDDNVLADQTLQHTLHSGDNLVEIDRAEPRHLPPAERKQLAGQLSGARRGVQHLLEHLAAFRIVLQPPPQQHRVSRDDRQQVVKVMRNPAC